MDFGDKTHRKQFEEMYIQYQKLLRRIAYKFNVPVDDIEDMVHDTFLSYARMQDLTIRWACRRMRCANC